MELKHFKLSEFECKCGCGKNNINNSLLLKLETARKIANFPFIITSGSRCYVHNNNVGGLPNSQHIKGNAVDIKYITDKQLFRLIRGLIKAGFKRILIYPKSQFVHVDIGNEVDINIPTKILKIMEI